MNKKERELHGYIKQTEQFSGWNGEGDFDTMSNDDDMSYFDDGGDDGMSYASGGAANQATSQPYVIQYTNTAAAATTATIFGFNDNFGAANFGNAATVTITNVQGGSYGRIFTQAQNKPFVVTKWRFQSSNSAQLAVTINVNHTDANGKTMSYPMNLSIERDAYQQQADIIDVNRPVTIDGNTSLTFNLLASTSIVISMFPTAIISSKAVLNGGAALNRSRAPRLSGRNVAPVIIQTTQDVRGITN